MALSAHAAKLLRCCNALNVLADWPRPKAIGFLIGTLWLGARLVPPLVNRLTQLDLPGNVPILAVIITFGLAWLAAAAGSAVIIGDFAAGLLLRRSPQAQEIEAGLLPLGRFFVPIFFVIVGATVDSRWLNPADPDQRSILLVAGPILVAVVGKRAAGCAPLWFKCRRAVIGWAMVPRGAGGLVFAQFALVKGVIDNRVFSAVTRMVILTILVAPPMMRLLLPPRKDQVPLGHSGAGDLVSKP